MCKETSEVSEGRQEPFEKITNTTFLLNKDFLVIQQFFSAKVSLQSQISRKQNKARIENRKFQFTLFFITEINLNTSMGGLFLNLELALYFQTKMKRKLQESQLIQIVLKTERCCLVLTKNQICLWSIIANIIYTDTRQLTGNPANIIYLKISKRQYFGFLI